MNTALKTKYICMSGPLKDVKTVSSRQGLHWFNSKGIQIKRYCFLTLCPCRVLNVLRLFCWSCVAILYIWISILLSVLSTTFNSMSLSVSSTLWSCTGCWTTSSIFTLAVKLRTPLPNFVRDLLDWSSLP